MVIAFLQPDCGLSASATDIEKTPISRLGEDLHQIAILEDVIVQVQGTIGNQGVVRPSLNTGIPSRHAPTGHSFTSTI